MRMKDSRPAKIYEEWKPHGGRSVRRTGRRWINGMSDVLGVRRQRFADIEQLRKYNDGRRWKEVVLNASI